MGFVGAGGNLLSMEASQCSSFPLHFQASDPAHPHCMLCTLPRCPMGESYHWTVVIVDSGGFQKYSLVYKLRQLIQVWTKYKIKNGQPAPKYKCFCPGGRCDKRVAISVLLSTLSKLAR